ncbi:Interleukin-20 [Galemys pyrenaicus]|uniref:Interleukin family protein n=1 Tax=Galemys pyrenaicus TaxID=202257 RepID=A0A8J6AGX6_GALPY|nr:Interleukin-20 [Galemys pyrenaicus]
MAVMPASDVTVVTAADAAASPFTTAGSCLVKPKKESTAPVVSGFWHKMRSPGLALCLLTVVLHHFWTPSSGLKTLSLGSCVFAANLQEMRNGFSEIRSGVQAKDEIIDVRILRRTESLRDAKPVDRCCLLHHILRLYLERIFKNYQTQDHRTLRKISGLANSLLSIKKDLRLCHARMACPCGKEAMEKYGQILSHFEEVEAVLAVVGRSAYSPQKLCQRKGRTNPGAYVVSLLLTTLVCVFQLNPQAAVVKALGELDILLNWMEEMD